MSADPDPPAPPARPRRRVRYAGTHPRTFGEKYKERDPQRFPETVQKVLASGKTPAGAHVPILVAEILAVLKPRPGEVAVDATLGHGGHAEALVPLLLPGGRLIGLDVDPLELPRAEARLRAAGLPEAAFTTRRMNFAELPRLLADEGLAGVDLVLADLGVSSMQLDDPARGFTFKREGPLDLRMNPEQGASAERLLARIPRGALEEALAELADEPRAREIAAAIVAARSRGPIRTTTQLANAVRGVLATFSPREQREQGDLPIRRTFQAVRILVNDEMPALDAFLAALPGCLNPGGRAAILSFHSGEDRRVKKAFRAALAQGLYAEVAPDVVRAGDAERRDNPRSSSAKLRWAVRSARPAPL
ncbi:MAG: 16S rRNA (cytosine(1402)-N(4))-methyltransferase RsmH [Thermoanaerobaculia bacterium]